MIMLGVVAAALVSAVTVAVLATRKPEPACGCTVEPDVRRPAHTATVRFEALVRQGDTAGAWALLTDGARSRYVDVAGFQPVLDRMGKALQGTGDWLVVEERVRYGAPSDVVVVRTSTGPPRLVWPLLVRLTIGQTGDERIDPEVPALPLTAAGDGPGVRVELAAGDLRRTSFVVIDGAGQQVWPARAQVTETVERLTWRAPLPGPVLVIGIEESATQLRVGAATATVG
jgi:hypothetical protein